ncbi:hypothetical protein BRADI_1g52621v3 [Brachypodium distachyon]|uniref:Secreted protein n=1 Tax=Brachypodium distachyon TaxID=15368 RepID=A0A0Q3S4M3_BRADI|nr:hypothetical protein BRADI_1g52621v3 [Brachypodium distachyon]
MASAWCLLAPAAAPALSVSSPLHPEASMSRGRLSRRGGGTGGTRSWCAWPPKRRRSRGARPRFPHPNSSPPVPLPSTLDILLVPAC